MRNVRLAILLAMGGMLCTLTACKLEKKQGGSSPPTDKTVLSASGGFEFNPLEGYKTREAAGNASMFLPQGDEQSGPGMILSGLTLDQAVSLEQAEAVIVKTYPAYRFEKSKPYHVDKLKGIVMDFTTVYHAPDGIILEKPGADEGEALQGRVVVVMVSPTRQFRCLMLAPADQWKSVRHNFDKVMDSVHFFTP